MKGVRKVVALLLVLVMLSSVVSPVMACGCAKETNKDKDAKVAVVEVKGMEKNKALAKALKNGDVKKLLNLLTEKGYKLKLAKAKVVKTISDRGQATLVSIPLNAEVAQASIVYVTSQEGISVGAAEIVKKGEIKQMTLYYIDADGKIKSYTVQGTSECWNCIWSCTFECIVEQCAPYIPGLCSFCYPILQCCLMLPGPENPCCEGAIICYGSFALGCFLGCTYDCNQRGECP